MVKRILIFAGLLGAVSAFGGTTYNNKPVPSTGTDFTPVYSGKSLAHVTVSFCEHGDTVIENFFLGKASDKNTYIYVEETIFPTDGPSPGTIWVRGKEPLGGCNQFVGRPADGDCGKVTALFTRPIHTGSGINGENAGSGCKAVTYSFNDHGGDIYYTYSDADP